MSSPAYMMITVAACAPDFLGEAVGHTGHVAEELKSEAGAISTRVGVISTGEHTGSLFLLQTYSELNGIDAAFSVYASSSHYKALIGGGKISVTLRNIIKLEDINLSNPTTDVPAFGVLTRWGSSDLMLDRAKELIPHFDAGGAMILRYGTIMTGNAAGRRLLAVAYPSMDAIEKTYGALQGDPKYGSFISDIDVDFRDIVRITA
jgi:hypothetical protein